ncbi:hypothetical protein B1A_09157, partial [mine drainage metagenome]
FSMGIGDRFGRQGKAQLAAFILAAQKGAEIIPVWNKSNREHLIVHSEPGEVRIEADAAVKALGWKHSYHVDADHIGIKTVDRFIAPSDFFYHRCRGLYRETRRRFCHCRPGPRFAQALRRAGHRAFVFAYEH